MARYDAGWNRMPNRGSYEQYDQPSRSDQSFRTGIAEGRGWPGAFGGGFNPQPGQSGGEGVYGPARYGLGPYHERLHRSRRSDDELRDEVEQALFYDTWVDADAITVEVKSGIVTLRGELPDYEEIRYATDDAWDVDGVRGVRSELSIRGE